MLVFFVPIFISGRQHEILALSSCRAEVMMASDVYGSFACVLTAAYPGGRQSLFFAGDYRTNNGQEEVDHGC